MTITEAYLFERSEEVTYAHFKWKGYPFSIHVHWEHSVIVHFRHQWDEKITCPFCGRTTFGPCKGVIEKEEEINHIIKQVLSLPEMRLRVLTETSMDIENPPLSVSYDPRQPLLITEVKKRLAFFQTFAQRLDQPVFAIHNGLTFVGVGPLSNQTKLFLDGTTQPFSKSDLMDPRVDTILHSFFGPYFIH